MDYKVVYVKYGSIAITANSKEEAYELAEASGKEPEWGDTEFLCVDDPEDAP